jgi:hypothetical protein
MQLRRQASIMLRLAEQSPCERVARPSHLLWEGARADELTWPIELGSAAQHEDSTVRLDNRSNEAYSVMSRYQAI